MSAASPTWRSAVLPRPQTYLGQKTVCWHNTFLRVLEPDDDHHMKRCASSPELICGHSIAFPSLVAGTIDTMAGSHIAPTSVPETDSASSMESATGASTDSKHTKKFNTVGRTPEVHEFFSHRAQTPSTSADANSERHCPSEEDGEQYIGDMTSLEWQDPAELPIGVDAETFLKLVSFKEADALVDHVVSAGHLVDEDSVGDEHPSFGSAKHAMNICKPCHYFNSKAGCKHGSSCSFCHYGHARRSTRDIPKSQRAQCLRHVAAVHQCLPGSNEKVLAERQLLAWLTSDSRIGAYTFKALRSFQGPSSFRADVLEFSAKATAVRQGREIADIEPCPDQAELACFAHVCQTHRAAPAVLVDEGRFVGWKPGVE